MSHVHARILDDAVDEGEVDLKVGAEDAALRVHIRRAHRDIVHVHAQQGQAHALGKLKATPLAIALTNHCRVHTRRHVRDGHISQ